MTKIIFFYDLIHPISFKEMMLKLKRHTPHLGRECSAGSLATTDSGGL